METLLLKAAIANGDDYEAEFSFLKHNNNNKGRCCDTGALPRQLSTMEEGEDIMF